METFLSSAAPHPVFLIAPPPLQPGERVTDPAQIAASSRLAGHYRVLAGRLEIPFADAGEWKIPLSYDGVHFTEAGHKTFAEKLHKELTYTPLGV